MLLALALLAAQLPNVGDLAPDYFELGGSFWNADTDGRPAVSRAEEGRSVDFAFGWLLGVAGTSSEEKEAWRALRDANLQRDELTLQLELSNRSLERMVTALESMEERQDHDAHHPPETTARSPPSGGGGELEDPPGGSGETDIMRVILAIGGLLTALGAVLKGDKVAHLVRTVYSTNPPPSSPPN